MSAAPRLQTAHAQLTVEDFPTLELQDFGYVPQERIEALLDEDRQRSVEPFQIFDNLYYVGIEWVGSFLIVTTDGLILIDSSPPFTVRLSAHPSGPGAVPGTGFFERRERLQTRRGGEPHPFVEDPSVFMEVLEQAEGDIERAILALP